jgi:hypothetical protein
MTADDPTRLDRRRVLEVAAAGAATSLAGCSLFESGADADTADVDDDRARELAERFAPTIRFDSRERWFPTDPRQFESDRDGETVVDGFDALNGYVAAGGYEDPPEPRVFYNVREYADSPLSVVQFWLYGAFDQFTTNFHWHDWELLQVFVDTDSGDPQLYVASSHSRSVPNNEFLDPDPDGRPRILSELGSHSSGLSVNANEEQFQRFPTDGDVADITNSAIETLENAAAIPLAYGLPRDEGLTLPFAVPELDGEPLYDHDDLPAVEAADLVPDDVTVRSFDVLSSPPAALPTRENGRVFEHEGRDGGDADVTYDLAPTADLEHIVDFAGPQLSFEFAIPQFAEDAFASHITTTGVPWADPRYEQPASDVTDPRHRGTLADRYDAIGDPAPLNQVVAVVTDAISAPEAPDGEGVTTESTSVESVALLESDPEAVPTFQGVAAVQNVPDGDHTLTVNGAGVAPHSEPVATDGEGRTTMAGVNGEIPLVARENAVKLNVDGSGTDADLTRVAVADDFGGRLYDAPLDERDGLYVHRGGAFTTEVRDTDDEVGAFRVNPNAEASEARVENATTGKRPLATYVADVAAETQAQVEAVAAEIEDEAGGGRENAVGGLAQALAAVVDAAERAAERADAGDREQANSQLETVLDRLGRVTERLADASDAIPDDLGLATEKRLQQARTRTEQAQAADRL